MAVKQESGAAEVEPIVVDIEDEKPLEIEIEAPKNDEPQLPLEPEVAKVAAEPKEEETPEPEPKPEPEPEPKAEPKKPDGPDPVAELKAQLERMRADAARERKAREEIERELGAASTEVHRSRTEIADTRLHAIVNAISAEKNEAEIAESAYAKAASEGDWDGAAKAQRIIARCESRLASLEDGKQQLEAWLSSPARKAEPKAPARARTEPSAEPSADPIEDYIASRSERVQTYLKSRDRSWLSDPKLNHRLIAAHNMALAEGYAEESNGYFAFIDQQMGAKTEMKTEPPKKKEPPKQAKSAIPAAPVTGKSASAGATNGASRRVTLTPGQQQAAKDLGLTLAEYADRVWKMKQPDWTGPKFGGN